MESLPLMIQNGKLNRMKIHTLFAVPVIAAALMPSCSRTEASRNVLQNKGSDTLVNVAQAWAEKYKDIDSSVAIAVSGGGSGVGIAALLNGTVDIANASRKIKQKEIELAKKNGVEPIEFIVGYDALAIYVHKNNPVKALSLAQLKDIYADGGGSGEPKSGSWDKLGLEVPGCASKKIVRVSRQNNSGTYAYFRETVLGKGSEFANGSLDLHGSKDVVDLCEKTPCAIGYSGLAYVTDHVKLVPVSTDGGAPVTPSVETAIDRTYPIARPLFMYTNGQPEGAVKKYMDWILSDEGQKLILNMGYAPVRNLKK